MASLHIKVCYAYILIKAFFILREFEEALSGYSRILIVTVQIDS